MKFFTLKTYIEIDFISQFFNNLSSYNKIIFSTNFETYPFPTAPKASCFDSFRMLMFHARHIRQNCPNRLRSLCAGLLGARKSFFFFVLKFS